MLESGVDQSGLTKEVFTLYWKEVFAKDASGGGMATKPGMYTTRSPDTDPVLIPLFRSASNKSMVFVPSPHDSTMCGQGKEPCEFFNIGRMLLKSIGAN